MDRYNWDIYRYRNTLQGYRDIQIQGCKDVEILEYRYIQIQDTGKYRNRQTEKMIQGSNVYMDTVVLEKG